MKSSQDWQAIRSLLPYVWQYKTRVILALVLLCLAKVANVSVPLVLKGAVDALDPQLQDVIYLPVILLIAYGLLRLASTVFNELRDALFAKVIYSSVRHIAGNIFHIYIVFPYVFICSAKPAAFHEILNVAVGVSLFY